MKTAKVSSLLPTKWHRLFRHSVIDEAHATSIYRPRILKIVLTLRRVLTTSMGSDSRPCVHEHAHPRTYLLTIITAAKLVMQDLAVFLIT
jgi:hypothetical protein